MSIETQTAIHANADNQANSAELVNERAIDELIVNGAADSAHGSIELDDVLLAVAEDELIISILYKLNTGDLTGISDLRLLTKAKANEKILEMAEFSH